MGGLRGLDTAKIKRFQARVAAESGPYTANRVRSLLGNALGDAVNEGRLAVNPAAAVRPVKHQKKPIEIWTAAEIAAALAAARHGRYFALIYMALATGMGFGELAGLRWPAVVFYPTATAGDAGEVKIERALVLDGGRPRLSTPKTPQGRRIIGFSAETKGVLLEQQEMLELERNPKAQELVFPTGSGAFLDVTNIDKTMKRIIKRAGVKPITFHDLRHTFASMMIAAGVNVVRLARILGHRDAGFTLRTYAHFFERQQREAMPSLSELAGLGGQNWGQGEGEGGGQEDKDAA